MPSRRQSCASDINVDLLGLASQPDAVEQNVQVYGWDLRTRVWHGPHELNLAGARHHRLVEALGKTPGASWHGPVTCTSRGELNCRFFVVTHDRGDCGVAMIYSEESKAGPVEIMAVVPASRRARLRPEFAFEFVAFAGFLGSLSGGADVEVNEGIEAALQATAASDSLVFSLSTDIWTSDQELVLSRCVEQTAAALLHWLARPLWTCTAQGASP